MAAILAFAIVGFILLIFVKACAGLSPRQMRLQRKEDRLQRQEARLQAKENRLKK